MARRRPHLRRRHAKRREGDEAAARRGVDEDAASPVPRKARLHDERKVGAVCGALPRGAGRRGSLVAAERLDEEAERAVASEVGEGEVEPLVGDVVLPVALVDGEGSDPDRRRRVLDPRALEALSSRELADGLKQTGVKDNISDASVRTRSWQMAVVSTKLCGSRATLSRLYSHRFQPL